MPRRLSSVRLISLAALVLTVFCSVNPASAAPKPAPAPAAVSCTTANTVTANVVSLDQPFMLNRLGAAMPQGMVFALASDVVNSNNNQSCSVNKCTAGAVRLRADKRPRPIVLRVNKGQCLKINFANWLAATPPSPLQPVTRSTSIHVNGLELATSIADDGSNVGKNASSLVPSGGSKTYTYYAAEEGTFLLNTMGSTFGVGSEAGQQTDGLFGAVTVEPPNAEYYRSQITRADLLLAVDITKGNKGFTPDGHPILNYQAVYPSGTPRAGTPILRMVDANRNTVHTDLNAIITGPNAGRFPDSQSGPEFNPISPEPNRREPFREFTIHYHEVTSAVQAFADFYNTDMTSVLAPGKDNFAINYGTGAIGAEILANRVGVGPMWNCEDCKFEEFFLASWAVGDPAMVVNVPANIPSTTTYPAITNPNVLTTWVNAMEQLQVNGTALPSPSAPQKGQKATQAFFPDDPSNVYHSYLQDHVTFRILHAGSNLTHVHHQHAHQWIHTPNDANSSYLDSQLISPGATYSLEIDYNGGGNRNQTLGDSIFHCHFYPHFAAGMWSLFRVHDVFEAGTTLQNGIPAAGARALPDGEIAAGTPIPAIVPLPTKAMAPIPAQVELVPVIDPKTTGKLDGYEAKTIAKCDRLDGSTQGTCTNPGFPFFVPGIAGHRAPAPPLDFAPALNASGQPILGPNGKPTYLDGGLARHVVLSASVDGERHNKWDFSKDNHTMVARELEEAGTAIEKAAMAYNAVRNHPSFTSAGQPATFITNGLPRGPQPGAPFADPAIDDNGKPIGEIRRYKAADIQTDVVFNKNGWHYPQERFITLWSDVSKTFSGQRAPEPFFFRANSKDDIVEFWQTNLVPSYYELDNFQVRTPTDILGQHIHLVKFDVLASDGAANGYNYEDGTLSPNEVTDRIEAIRAENKCYPKDPRDGTFVCPVAKEPTPANGYPVSFGKPPAGQSWLGASTTIQRWYADSLEGCPWPPCADNGKGKDRTLRTVFTHDHFGPSTHQQAGLYAGLVVEPEKSKWVNSENGSTLGGGIDGGPTSWQANIVTPNTADSYREFLLEFQDLALAYNKNSIGTAVPYPQPPPVKLTTPWGWCDNSTKANTGINPPGSACAPTIISGSPVNGTMNVNYRNEPLPFRVDPCTTPGCTPAAHDPSNRATDLSYVFSSAITRNEAILNTQPAYPQKINGSANNFQYPPPLLSCGNCVQNGDPYTPLLRAFQNDRVQIRVLVGAYLFNHNFGIEGLKWLFEPSSSTSGYRDNQAMGISEHYEFQFKLPSTQTSTADYLYMPGSGVLDVGQGLWGILRSYNAAGKPSTVPNLQPLPNNPGGGVALKASASCPTNATGTRTYNMAAVYVPEGIVYNSHDTTSTPSQSSSITSQSGALVYVMADGNGNPLLGALPPREPLVVRASAGECINVNLYNRITAAQLNAPNSVFTTADGNITGAGGPTPWQIPVFPSARVGMHAQLVGYDVSQNNGVNVGMNPDQITPPCPATGTCTPRKYQWYAGAVTTNADGTTTGVPIELGSVNLIASDPIEQQPLAMIAALIIEPAGAQWPTSGTSADIRDAKGNPLFREFVTMIQNNVYLTANEPDSSNNFPVFNSTNFGAEPMPYRYQSSEGVPPGDFDSVDISQAFSNQMPNPFYTTPKPQGEPQTPIFCALAGTPVRFRMLHPDGLGGFPDDVWTIHGHVWPEEPFVTVGNVPSASIGNNPNSQWFGGRDGFGPGNHFDIVLASAGGTNKVAGDYLYKSYPVGEFASGGNWGLFRVNATQQQQATCTSGIKPPTLLNVVPGVHLPIVPPALEKTPSNQTDPEERFLNRRPKPQGATQETPQPALQPTPAEPPKE
jgi:hypothetical protein